MSLKPSLNIKIDLNIGFSSLKRYCWQKCHGKACELTAILVYHFGIVFVRFVKVTSERFQVFLKKYISNAINYQRL